MKEKILNYINNVRRLIIEYVVTNRLFVTYVLISLIGMMITRFSTLGEFFTFRSLVANLALILMIGSLSYVLKPKNRFKYLFFWILVFTLMGLVNTIYYKFYASFASFGELAMLGQAETVTGSIYDKLHVLDFIYIFMPIIFYGYHKKIKKTSYYNFITKFERKKTKFTSTLAVGGTMLFFILSTSTATDFSRLGNQWNRLSNMERFGLIFYQFNDLVQTLKPQFSSLFGYEEAAEAFNEYFAEENVIPDNKYTGVLEGKNIVFIHMESIQTFLMDLSYNGVEVTPNLNKLADEGMFFTNFFPQISTGTSSDAEFTLLSSMYPASTGTVFVSYYDRNYITIPKVLSEKGYTTFSMHGNNFTMWNRSNAHPSLGYEEFYYKDKYDFTEEDEIGLGINDSLFFEQSIAYLEEIESSSTNYMGTVITLSNHSPFESVDKYVEYDLSTTFEVENEDGITETVTTDYLSKKSIGRYLKSSHFADLAMGEFIDMVNESEYFNDTVFVFYGDHDAKFSQSEMNYLINYDYMTGDLKEESDPTYVEYDSFDHELDKNTPLIIWSKNEEIRETINGEFDYPMGTVDVAPTLYNMLGVYNEYSFGNDIFTAKDDNYVVFPNANFLTADIYYNNSKSEYKALREDVILTENYIEDYLAKTEEKLTVSNSIIVHNLIEKEVLDKE